MNLSEDKLKTITIELNRKFKQQDDRLTYAEVLYDLGVINERDMYDMIEDELLNGGRHQWGGSQKEFHFERGAAPCYTDNEINVLSKTDFFTVDNDHFWIDFGSN